MQSTSCPAPRVRTTAGIYGTVISGDDRDVIVEIAPGVNIRMLRRAVMDVVQDDARDRHAGRRPRDRRPRSTRRRSETPEPATEPAGPEHLAGRRSRRPMHRKDSRQWLQPTTTSRPGRLLAGPGRADRRHAGGRRRRVRVPARELARAASRSDCGLDLSSGTTVTLQAVSTKNRSAAQPDGHEHRDLDHEQRVNGAGLQRGLGAAAGQRLHHRRGARPGRAEGGQPGGHHGASCGSARCCCRGHQTPVPRPADADAHPDPVGQRRARQASASPSPSASAHAPARPGPAPATSPKLSTTAERPGSTPPRSARHGQGPVRQAELHRQELGRPDLRQITPTWDNPKIQIVACYQGQKYALDKSTVDRRDASRPAGLDSLQPNGNWWVNLNFNGRGQGVRRADLGDVHQVPRLAHQPAEPVRDRAGRHAGVDRRTSRRGDHRRQRPDQGTFTQSQATNLANVLKLRRASRCPSRRSRSSRSRPQLGASQLKRGPDRGGDRPAAGGHLLVPLLPRPRPRVGVQPGHRRAAVVPVRGPAQQVRGLHPVAGRASPG